VTKFAKANKKLVLLGGGLGDKVLDAEDVKTLAALPSLDELRATIIGLINSPATKLAGVLQAPAGQLTRVLAARGAQGEPG
jgi:large subunit ribosomal protein L10